MSYTWNPTRNLWAAKLKQTLKLVNSKTGSVNSVASAAKLASIYESNYKKVATSFNKIATREGKRAYLQPFKTSVHCLSGKYTPTAMALLEFLEVEDIKLDRWILAQAECIKQEFFNLYMCYGAAALQRYTDWEARQSKKFIRTVDHETQTDSALEEIRSSIIAGHIAAMSWIPQLEKLEAPDLPTGLFFLLPNIQGWYALCYEEFRQEVMETGLCDLVHMSSWYKRYKRSAAIQSTCHKALAFAVAKYGKFEWGQVDAC